jgi:two-component system chemotaxis response regulator CheY
MADIYEASGGNEAISQYKLIQPELVFLDITMPDIDGITVVKELIKLNPGVHIIMCTSSNDRMDVRECIMAGAKDYIVKPPNTERIIKAVEKFRGPIETNSEEGI